MIKETAAIAFFCFNRADKTKITLESLAQNDLASDSEIFIFCDGPRNIKELEQVKEVHKIIDNISGFKKVHIYKKDLNHGLRSSVIDGINYILKNHNSFIVIEDDIVTSKNFLKFINQALEFYKDEKNIWCITGFNFPTKILPFPKQYKEDIFFVRGKNSSWGWGGWKDRWKKIDFDIEDYDQFIKNKKLVKEFNRPAGNMSEMLRFQKQGKINSWAIAMSYAMFKEDGYTVHPVKTMVKNIGFDENATHTTSKNLSFSDFNLKDTGVLKLKKLSEVENNFLAEKSYTKYHNNSSSLKKWFTSKKKRKNLQWLLIGFVIAELINYLFK